MAVKGCELLVRMPKGRGVIPRPFGQLASWFLASRFGLGLGPRILLRHRAAGDGNYLVLDRGDRAVHARPDADREALINGFADLLLVLDVITFGDERRSRLEEAATQT